MVAVLIRASLERVRVRDLTLALFLVLLPFCGREAVGQCTDPAPGLLASGLGELRPHLLHGLSYCLLAQQTQPVCSSSSLALGSQSVLGSCHSQGNDTSLLTNIKSSVIFPVCSRGQ